MIQSREIPVRARIVSPRERVIETAAAACRLAAAPGITAVHVAANACPLDADLVGMRDVAGRLGLTVAVHRQAIVFRAEERSRSEIPSRPRRGRQGDPGNWLKRHFSSWFVRRRVLREETR